MELLRSVASDFRTYTTFKGDRWSGTLEYDITLSLAIDFKLNNERTGALPVNTEFSTYR